MTSEKLSSNYYYQITALEMYFGNVFWKCEQREETCYSGHVNRFFKMDSKAYIDIREYSDFRW